MRHCDEDTLAALALGDPVSADDAAHAETCERCSAEVAALRALQATLVDAGGAGPLQAPPTRVWDAIEAELRTQAPAEEPRPALPAGVTALPTGAQREDMVRRRFRPWVVGAAAAAGVVIGGVGVALVGLDSEPDSLVIAQARLADLETEDAAGTATVEVREDGTEVLVVDTNYVANPAGGLEVWLIDPDVVGMVSLGFLTGDHQEFEIPAGYDVEAFPIVDISVEPPDGDPTHSGASITRGILET